MSPDTLYCPFEKICGFYKPWAEKNNTSKDVINVGYMSQQRLYSCRALSIESDKNEIKVKFSRINCSYIHSLNKLEQGKK